MGRSKDARRFGYVAAAAGLAAAIACGDTGDGLSSFGPPGGGSDSGTPVFDGSGFDPGDGGAGDGALNADSACAATVAEPKRAGVDVIFVIDNSHSMSDEIRKIQTNINTFAEIIRTSGLDYRVIMITAKGTNLTDAREDVPNLKGSGVTADYPFEVCVPSPLGVGADGGCGDNAPRFRHVDHFPMGVASTNGLSLILGTYPASYRWPGNVAGPPGGGWVQYARFDATKFFVMVTDDDAKFPEPVVDAGATEETYQVFDRKLLTELTPAGMFGTAQARKYVYSAITGWAGYPGGTTAPGGGCISAPDAGAPNTAVNQGPQHQKLVALTGGILDSICKDDWSPVLRNLAQTVVAKIGCEYTIPRQPDVRLDPDKVLVRYTSDASGAAPETLRRVFGAAACQGDKDWYYDNDSDPSKVYLCPAACSTIGASATGKVDVLIACGGIVPR